MARPQREGLDYFPIVTSFDDKIELIIAEFGPEGLGIIVGLYQRIYSNGYYMNWNEDTLMLFASKHINAEKTRVNAVIMRSLDRNIFNKELFIKYSILTSSGIQKQFLKVCRDCRRKSVQFIKEYCLIKPNDKLFGVITELIGINTEETPKNDVESTQREIEREIEIERERKEKEKEERKETSSSAAIIDPGFAEVINVFNNNIHSVTPIEAQKLEDWLTNFEPQIVIKAIEEAVAYNKRSYGYINAVLESWQNNNLKTIQDVEAYLRDRTDKKNIPKFKSNNHFVNYGGQRQYDVAKLKKQLLGRGDSGEE